MNRRSRRRIFRRAPRERQPQIVENSWFSKGFQTYPQWRQPARLERGAKIFTPDKLGTALFCALNKITELEVKNKVARGKKLRVAFFLDSLSKFKTITVYRHLLADDMFEPFITLYNTFEYHINDDTVWQVYLDDYKRLKSKGYTVFHGYDTNRKYIPIETYKPDLVIVSSLYLEKVYMFLSQTYLNINFLTCVFNYGFNINAGYGYDYFYNNIPVNTAWKHFVETQIDYAEFMRYSRHFGANCVYLGSPALDLYKEPDPSFALPAKIDNGNPIVIYAPHHSIHGKPEGYNLATFHIYHEYFYNLAKEHPDINFVIKPHPSLGYKLSAHGIMTQAEYKQYLDRFAALPNAVYYFDGDYINIFKRASLLITDSASFIVEWLPSGSPCLYLVNPERNPHVFLSHFSRLARMILEKYYLCYNIEDITAGFNKIIYDRLDPLKEERKKLCNQLFPDIGTAGKKVVDYLHDVLTY